MWFAILFTIVIALVIVYLVYYFCFKPYNYWKNRGIIYEIPTPLVGNFGSTLLRKKHVSEIIHSLYKKYSNDRYVGIYIFTKPALLVRDVDLVKRICVDEFDHFCDTAKLFDKEIDTDITGNLLPNLTGNRWKETRDFLCPIFGSAQIKGIFSLASEFAEHFTKNLVEENKTLVEIQLHEIISKFENGIISSTIFGIKDESFMQCKGVMQMGALEKLKMFLAQLAPCIAELFAVRVCPTSKTEFFKKMVLEAIEKRQLSKTARQDFVQYLVEAKQGNFRKGGKSKEKLNEQYLGEENIEAIKSDDGKSWTAEEIATHSLIFLSSHAGLEPLITSCTCMAHELALNPDIQVKLQEEIDNVLQNSKDSKLTYEALLEMEYLDCVISECLRKWPPLYHVDRECVKNYFEVDLPIPDDEKIVIEKGTAVIIPIVAIQRDANYFPDPQRFNPERFNAENRDDIVPGAYIPFGWGPRACIGSQFAILQMKVFFFHLLSKFDLVPTENTSTHVDPLRFDRPSAACTILGLKPRRVTSL